MAEDEDVEVSEEESLKVIDPRRKQGIRYLKYIAAFFFLLTIIALVSIKVTLGEDFSTRTFSLLLVGSIVIFGAIFFSNFVIGLFKKIGSKKDEEKLPNPITLWEARRIMNDMLVDPDYADVTYGSKYEKSHHVGVKGEWIQEFAKYAKFQKENSAPVIYHMIINMHYPERRALLTNPHELEIRRTVRTLPTKPSAVPDVETTTTHTPHLGVTTTTQKRTQKRKAKSIIKSQIGDL